MTRRALLELAGRVGLGSVMALLFGKVDAAPSKSTPVRIEVEFEGQWKRINGRSYKSTFDRYLRERSFDEGTGFLVPREYEEAILGRSRD